MCPQGAGASSPLHADASPRHTRLGDPRQTAFRDCPWRSEEGPRPAGPSRQRPGPACLPRRTGTPRRLRRPRSCWARPAPLFPWLLLLQPSDLSVTVTSSAQAALPSQARPRPLVTKSRSPQPPPTSRARARHGLWAPAAASAALAPPVWLPVCPTPSRGPAASEPCTCRSPRSMRGPCLRLSRSPREATPDPRATLPHHPARSGHPQTLLYCLSRPVFTSGTTRYVCFETRRSFASWLPSQDRSSVRGISAMFAAPRTAPGSGSAGCRQLCLAGRDVTATSVRAGTVRVCARHRVRASATCLTRGRCPTNTDWIKVRGRGGLLGNGPLQRERGTGLRGEGVRVGRAPQDARPRGRRWRG